ncbi:transposase [Streptomyces narbonensis]|uniref:Transposase n=1 Tax=Streptomyces narbonensis TaxID=67333 RepID=A0ABV3CL51_9ACTN
MTDAEWERLRPFQPVSNGRGGRWRDHWQVIDGILCRVRTGAQWRHLREWIGPWKTIYERRRLGSADGTGECLLQQVQAAADAAGEIDETSRSTPPSSAHTSITSKRAAGGMPGRNAVEPGRPPGGGGTAGEGLAARVAGLPANFT